MTRTRRQIEQAFYAYLERSETRYCVLGANDSGGDIDIAIDPLDAPALFAMMDAFCRKNDIRLVQVLQHERSAFYFALAWPGNGGPPHYLHPDICGDYVRDDRYLLSAEELTRDRRPGVSEKGKALGYQVPAPATDFIYYLLKKIDKRELDDHHGKQLSAAWNRDTTGALAEGHRFWSGQEAALLTEAAASGDWEEVGS